MKADQQHVCRQALGASPVYFPHAFAILGIKRTIEDWHLIGQEHREHARQKTNEPSLCLHMNGVK